MKNGARNGAFVSVCYRVRQLSLVPVGRGSRMSPMGYGVTEEANIGLESLPGLGFALCEGGQYWPLTGVGLVKHFSKFKTIYVW